MEKTDRRIDAVALRRFGEDVYRNAGVPPEDARLLADSLVQADLWGHQSHGVLRLGWYLARLRSGAMRGTTEPEAIGHGAISLIDGRDGIGQVIAQRAMHQAIARAKEHGIAAVGVRNSNHFGTAMYFTRQAAEAGCIGFLSTNASPAIAPWGGRKKMIGNNPWSIAAPAGRHAPMMLDIANTAVARGKIYLARQRGERIPLGWAFDRDGVPTQDPQAAIDGLIQPMGGHKGYGISLMMDVLSGVLTGSAFASDVHGPYQAEHRSGCGHFAMAIHVEALLPLSAFNARMEALVEQLKSAPRASGHEAIYYPGEIEALEGARNARDGLVLPDETRRDLRQISSDTGIPLDI